MLRRLAREDDVEGGVKDGDDEEAEVEEYKESEDETEVSRLDVAPMAPPGWFIEKTAPTPPPNPSETGADLPYSS